MNQTNGIAQAARILRSDLANYQAALTELIEVANTRPEAFDARTPDPQLDRIVAAIRRQNVLSQNLANAFKHIRPR
jgi:endonuclease/exonuclease/phosphatase family metal-dependent hydrolase